MAAKGLNGPSFLVVVILGLTVPQLLPARRGFRLCVCLRGRAIPPARLMTAIIQHLLYALETATEARECSKV